jgi:hypothetical protein
MKALSIITLAIFLGLFGTAMANDSGENRQDGGNAVGPNPYMTAPSKLRSMWLAEDAFAMHPVQHQVVKPHVKN